MARNVERTVAAWLDAQQVLLNRSRQFYFLMPEHAVRWRCADSRVMAGQCAHMADVSEQLPNVEIAVVPQTALIGDVPLHNFVVYDKRHVEIELFSGEVVLRDPKEISYHLNIFDYFWQRALAGSQATTFLRSISDDFMRELD